MAGGVPGGFSGSGITPKLREIAATAAAKHLNNIDMVSGVLCDSVTLVDVLDANSQVGFISRGNSNQIETGLQTNF